MPIPSPTDLPRRRSAALWLGCALLPALVAIGVPAVILALSGEFLGPDRAAGFTRTGAPPSLFGLAYTNPTNRYKRLAAYAERREVVALGTSRVLQIRAEGFRPGTTFFNAGQAVSTLNGYVPMLEEWPAATRPRLLLLGLDQYFFNPVWREDEGPWTGLTLRADSPLAITEKSWREVWDDLLEDRIPFRALADRHREADLHGISARVDRAGFRNDGSYRYGKNIAKLRLHPDAPFDPSEAFDDTLEEVSKGKRRYPFGEAVSTRSLDDVRRFLGAAKADGIEVVGFLPPYAHVIAARMEEMGERFGYIRRLPAELGAVFAEFGFPLFDFTDAVSVGASDREMIDGLHTGEKATTRVLIRMAREAPALARHVDPAALEAALEAAPSPYEVFPDPVGD